MTTFNMDATDTFGTVQFIDDTTMCVTITDNAFSRATVGDPIVLAPNTTTRYQFFRVAASGVSNDNSGLGVASCGNLGTSIIEYDSSGWIRQNGSISFGYPNWALTNAEIEIVTDAAGDTFGLIYADGVLVETVPINVPGPLCVFGQARNGGCIAVTEDFLDKYYNTFNAPTDDGEISNGDQTFCSDTPSVATIGDPIYTPDAEYFIDPVFAVNPGADDAYIGFISCDSPPTDYIGGDAPGIGINLGTGLIYENGVQVGGVPGVIAAGDLISARIIKTSLAYRIQFFHNGVAYGADFQIQGIDIPLCLAASTDNGACINFDGVVIELDIDCLQSQWTQ